MRKKPICFGIMATAEKNQHCVSLSNMEQNLSLINFSRACIGMVVATIGENVSVSHWTKLFATDEVVYTESIIQNFLSFIDHMPCSTDTYVSLGGSNGCADQLTNWDGTQKFGLGAPLKKEVTRFIQITTI